MVVFIYLPFDRIHANAYQEVLMKKLEGEDSARLLKATDVVCGGHMIDVITGMF